MASDDGDQHVTLYLANQDRDRHAISLPSSSASLHSKTVDITEQPIFKVGSGLLNEADVRKKYSLEDLVQYLGVPMPQQPDGSRDYNENLAGWALQTFFDNQCIHVHADVNKEVQGLSRLPTLQNSTSKRADVTIYDQNKERVLFQVGVQSPLMRETVMKSIHVASDMIRFLRNSSADFKRFIVFALPKCGVKKCAVKITVTWENLCFVYKLETLFEVSQVWEEMKSVVENLALRYPSLPSPDNVDPTLMRLSSDDLRPFGDAHQIKSPYHVIIGNSSNVYKLVTDITEQVCLRHIARRVEGNPQHFIVPEVMVEDTRMFKYTRVSYSPLSRVQARRCLRTLVVKINEALVELHGIGFAHSDIRLPNICFNCNYDAVLIDLDRCEPWNQFPKAVSCFAGKSCMYEMPEAIGAVQFNGKHMDYVQLGWLVAWVLSDESDYHDRKWTEQNEEITSDNFVSTLVLHGNCDLSALNNSNVVIDETDFNFVDIFQ